MKLAKKMLACAIALAMVAALALTAFAAAPTIKMSATKATVGETVTVTVAATDMAGLESAVLYFGYDPAVLEFVSAAAPAGAAFQLAGGIPVDKAQDGSDGVVSAALMYMEAADSDTDLAVLTFNVLVAGTTEVTLTVDSWDGTDAPADAALTIVAEDPTTAPDDTTTTTAPVTTTEAPAEDTSAVETTKGTEIPKTGEAGVAAIAGVMALAAVAFVATRKKDEE